MPTVTAPELKQRLENAGGIGTRTAAELPDPRLEANIGDAEGEVVGKLAAAGLKLEGTAGSLLKGIVADIAGWLATLEFFGQQELADRDPVVLRYQRARGLLRDITRGDLSADGVTATAPTEYGGEVGTFYPHGAVNLADDVHAPYATGDRCDARRQW